MRELDSADPSTASGPPRAGPLPLTARAVATFATRYGLTVEAIAARLGLEAAQLQAFDRVGGPGWLRLALVGVAVEREERPGALGWLMDASRPPAGHEAASGDGNVEASG